MPNWLNGIIVGIIAGIVGMALWGYFFGSNTINKEMKRNDHQPTPDEHQIKWHIQHIRQDIISITRILFLIFLILLMMLVRDFTK